MRVWQPGTHTMIARIATLTLLTPVYAVIYCVGYLTVIEPASLVLTLPIAVAPLGALLAMIDLDSGE